MPPEPARIFVLPRSSAPSSPLPTPRPPRPATPGTARRALPRPRWHRPTLCTGRSTPPRPAAPCPDRARPAARAGWFALPANDRAAVGAPPHRLICSAPALVCSACRRRSCCWSPSPPAHLQHARRSTHTAALHRVGALTQTQTGHLLKEPSTDLI
jgi:hypothetical protein